MKIRTRLAKYIGTAVATAAVIGGCIATACILETNKNPRNTSQTVKNTTTVSNDDYIYRPIDLEYESYNVPIVVSDYHKRTAGFTTNLNYSTVAAVDQAGAVLEDAKKWNESGTLDSACSWWVEQALPQSGTQDYDDYVYASDDATRVPFVAVNNKITIEDQNDSNIKWVMPFYEDADKINNCIKVDRTHQTQTIKFSNYDSYANLYLLATAANTPAQTASITCTVKYTTGDDATANFTVLDWFSSSTLPTDVTLATQQYTRFQIDKNANHYGRTYFGTSDYRYPKLYRCNINGLDTNRLVKEIEVQDTSGNSMVTTIYGVCGAFNNKISTPDPTATNIKNTSAKIEWTPITNAEKYYLDVYYTKETSNGTETIAVLNNEEIDDPTASSYDLTSLEAGETYTYRMRAADSSGQPTASSTEKQFTTNDAMTIKSPTNVTSSGFTANWEPLDSEHRTNVSKYVLQVSDSNSFTASESYDITSLDTSSTNITSYEGTIKQGQSYFYRIKYVYEDLTESEWSDIAEAEIPIDAISLTLNPKTVNLLTGGTTNVTSTVAGEDGKSATNQNVVWSGTGLNTIVKVETDESDPTKHTLTALKPGSVTLTATSEDGGFTDTCTVSVTPNAPTLNEASTTTYDSFNVKFTEPTEADGSNYTYTIEYATKSDFSDAKTASATHSSTSPQTIKISSNVAPLTKYYVRVKTLYTGGYQSAWSSTEEVTTTAIPPNSISVTGTTTINVTGSTTLSTQIFGPKGSPELASSQEIVWSSTYSGWENYLQISSTSDTTHKITALQACKDKTITLRATAKNDSTVYKDIDITINLPAPTISLVKTTTSTIQVNWTKVNGATYKLSYGKNGEFKDLTSTGTSYVISDSTSTPVLPNTTYYVYVSSVNNGVESMSNIIQPKTLEQAATGLTINPTSAQLLLGETLNVTSQVLGSTYEATDQTVTSTKTSGYADVTLTDNKKLHTIMPTKQGSAIVTYSVPLTTYTQTCEITVKDQTALDPTLVGTYNFTAAWADTGVTKYHIDVATDENFTNFVDGYNDRIINNATSIEISQLSPRTNYYYRVRYENNGYVSANSNVVSVTTLTDVTGITINHNVWEVQAGKIDENIQATVTSSDANPKQVNWKISDESIATIEVISTNSNTSSIRIKGLKVGSATITASIEGYPEITPATCVLTVTNTLKAPVLKTKDIKTNGFTAYWTRADESSDVTYSLHVWTLDNKGKQINVVQKSTKKTTEILDSSEYSKLVPGGTYHLTVTATLDGTEVSVTSNEEIVTLLAIPNKFTPEVIGGITGGAVGFWLLLSYILYIFWKKSILKTYDQKKAKDKARGKKVKTHDKYFRAIDKACVGFNKAVSRRSNSLMTRLGTKNEQKYLKKK